MLMPNGDSIKKIGCLLEKEERETTKEYLSHQIIETASGNGEEY